MGTTHAQMYPFRSFCIPSDTILLRDISCSRNRRDNFKETKDFYHFLPGTVIDVTGVNTAIG